MTRFVSVVYRLNKCPLNAHDFTHDPVKIMEIAAQKLLPSRQIQCKTRYFDDILISAHVRDI